MRSIGSLLVDMATSDGLSGDLPDGLAAHPGVLEAVRFWSRPCPRGCHLGRVREAESFGVTGRWDYCDCPKGQAARQRDAEDTRRAAEQRAAEQRETMRARVDRRLTELPAAYQGYTLASSPLAKHPAMRAVSAFLDGWDGTQDLIIQGDYGVGKTGLLVGILRELTSWMSARETDFALVDSVQLTREMNDAMRGRDDVGQLLKRYQQVGILAIDDVGVEGRLGSVTAAYWYELLNARYVRRRATLMTTNLDAEALTDFLGPRIMARLTERGSILSITQARDIRKAKRAGVLPRVTGNVT